MAKICSTGWLRAWSLSSHPLAYPLLLLALVAGTHLFLAFRLGFYWDDWQAVYLAQSDNPRLMWDYFAYDRPFSAWTYSLTFPLLGLHPLAWQVCTLLLRWLGVLALVSAFERAWPGMKYTLRWAGALLLVYPVFTLQSVSVAFNQHFLTFSLLAVSLWFSVQAAVAAKGRVWAWTLLALLTGLAHLFTMEYFAGLEILRPILVYIIFLGQGASLRGAIRKTLLIWLPFAAGLAVFAWWRFIYYPAHFPDPDELANSLGLLRDITASPAAGMQKLVNLISSDFYHLLVETWVNIARPTDPDFIARAGLLGLGIGLFLAVVFAIFLEIAGKASSPSRPGLPSWPSMAFLGLLAFLAGGLPVWLTGHQVAVGKWSDRFALAEMIGAVLMIVAVVEGLVQPSRRKVVLGLLLVVSVAAQVRTVNKYRLDWDYQRDFYWQLSWRAPALPPGTAIFSSIIPTDKLADYSTAYALNTLYAAGPLDQNAPYWFLTPRSLGYHFARFAPAEPIHYTLRNIEFTGNTSQAIAVIYRPARACLRLLDPVYSLDPRLEPDDRALLPVSNPDRVLVQDNLPRRDVFGAEPERGWCYYFQKADLARSRGDWSAVLSLMQQAEVAGFTPKDGSELLPLIEAYARLGQWQAALDASQRALQITGDLGNLLCTNWRRFSQLEGSAAAAQQALGLFACPAE